MADERDAQTLEWMGELEERVREAAERLGELGEENRRLAARVEELEESLDEARSGEAAEGDEESRRAAAEWHRERDEIRSRVEALSGTLEGLLKE